MNEEKVTEGIASAGETAHPEHAPHTLHALEEQVKVEGSGNTRENVSVSPPLFAQAGIEDPVPMITEQSEIAANGLSNVNATSAPAVQQTGLMDQANGVLPVESDVYAILDATLPLLPSLEDMSMPDAATSIIDSEPRVQAFAKLEFDDGQFYMNTWAVELGRDVRAAKKALQQGLKDQEHHTSSASKHRSNSSADGGQGSIKKREDSRKVAGSIISETGGILNYGPDGPTRTPKSSRRKARSEGSASRMVSRSNSILGMAMETESVNPIDLIFDHPPNAVQPVNPQTHLPSPDECPLIPIHPPATEAGSATGHRGISRRHVKIQYNFERRLFEMEVKGRNGAFVDEIHYDVGEIAELRSRCYIQIGGVGIRFILPNVADGETGAETTLHSEAVSAMSFDFEDGRGESVAMAEMSDSSSEPPESSEDEARGRKIKPQSSDDSDDSDEEERPRGGKKSQRRKKSGKETKSIPKIKLKLKTNTKEVKEVRSASPRDSESPSAEMDEEALKALGIEIPLAMIPPRRKGPGRPPKNGFMSKREEASLKKQAREAAKAQAVADGTLPADALTSPTDSSERRKLLKKENSKEIHESIEGNDGASMTTPAKLPKEKKPPKPPKSPSPFIDEASLTPEQLAKPQHSYVVMIHEALTNCPAGQMSLPQIYKAIERKYPYFKFKVTTPGWQSSIRHNLSQHQAFKKTETREGKGWMWCLDPDVSIEKEKRPRRPSPPPMTQQPYFPQGSHMYRPPFGYSGASQTTPGAPVPGQFPYQPAGGSSSTTQAAASSSTVPAPSPNMTGSYQSPYGGSGAKPNQLNSSHSQSVPVPPNANPYLLAQTHRPAQSSPLRAVNSQQQQSNTTAGDLSLGFAKMSPQAMNAITRYKSTLMESLAMPNREVIINNVIDKVMGKPVMEFTSLGDRTAAQAIEKPLVGLLQQIRENEQAAYRQRLAQASIAPPSNNAVTNPPTSTATTPANGHIPTQSATTNTASNNTQQTINRPSVVPTPQPVQPTVPTAAVPTSHSSQAVTPVASPITPVQTASPAATPIVSVAAEAQQARTEPSAVATAVSINSTTQRPFLSILSQLGPATSRPPTVSNGLTNGDNQRVEVVNGTRGTKRTLDEAEAREVKDNENSTDDVPEDGEDQPRATKRLAV